MPGGGWPALRAARFRDLPVLPYGRWRPAAPGARLDGGPVFPLDAPAWVHMPLRGGSHWARGPETLPAGLDPPRLAGRFALAGPCVGHFGHMIGEFLHRLWVLREDPALRPLLVATARTTTVPAYVADYLSLIGAPEPLLLAAPARLEEVVVGEPGRLLGTTCSAGYGESLGAMLPDAIRAPSGQAPRLAILRGHMQTGRCVGEAWIEGVLAAAGYRIFRPEAHGIAEQMAALTGAERIVASEGSALHLLDLLPPIRARVAVLTRGPGTVLAEGCLAEKAPGFTLFRPRFLLGSLAQAHPRSNALAFLDPMDFLLALRREGFIEDLPARGFLETPGLLEEDIAAYAAHFRTPRDPARADGFVRAALAACRAGRQDPALRASLLQRAAPAP